MNNLWERVSISAGISWLMKLILLSMLPYEIYIGDYPFAFATVIAIAVSFAPSIVERNYRITLPFELDLLITLAIFLHMFLGEFFMFYERVRAWDVILHLFSTSVISLLAFMIVYTLHYTRKLRLSIPLVGFFTVTFAMFVGALWEILEFIVDIVFDTTAQKGLTDTMWDLIYDLIAGVIVAIFGMAYVRYSKPEERKRMTRPLSTLFGAGRRGNVDSE